MNAAGDRGATRSAAIAEHAETWRYLEMSNRTSADDVAMISAALQSLDLWKAVGTPANEQRGCWLVARANIAAGDAAAALAYAERTLELTRLHHQDLEDFDRAFAEEIAARVYAMLGDLAKAMQHVEAARSLGASIADDRDRQTFFEQLEAGPWFGLGRDRDSTLTT